jgi:hypothetical protein
MSRTPGAEVDVGDSIKIAVRRESRLVEVSFAPNTRLTRQHGTAIVEALAEVTRDGRETFGLFADAAGVAATDADYRAVTGDFFSQHRATARIALINLGPIIRIVAEMFRVGIRLQMRTFDDEPAARAWLRKEGIGA